MANTFILANKAVKHYANAKIDRDSILGDNKGKSGIYLWYNRKNLKSYIGQSKDLGDPKKGRLLRYYQPLNLLYEDARNTHLVWYFADD